MPDHPEDFLSALSDALVRRVMAGRGLVAGIAMRGQPVHSGTLWRQDVVVASEQVLPQGEEATIALVDGGTFPARIAGRDAGTNIAVLRLDGGPAPAPASTTPPEPQSGALVLALGADGSGGVSARFGAVHSVGPAWHSRAGGQIDRRILLDIALGGREEGGPVLDAAGGLLGISTLGPRRRVLVIPAATVERVLEPLLTSGRVERGWLGAAVQPVLVPEGLQAEAGQSLGLIVIGVSTDGPAAQAGVLAGDILLTIDETAIGSPSQLSRILDMATIGRTVSLRLIRAGRFEAVGVAIGTRPPR
jgi:S1-C subfamily serine protease